MKSIDPPPTQLELLQLRQDIIDIILLLGSELLVILLQLVVLGIELTFHTKSVLTSYVASRLDLRSGYNVRLGA